MLTDCNVMAFVATAKPDEALVFYRDTLGLRLVGDDWSALVFDAGGTTLRVQKVEAAKPPPYTTLGWRVKAIEAEVRGLTEHGVAFERFEGLVQDELGIWTVLPVGAKVAWFKDPDGNLLSLTQDPA